MKLILFDIDGTLVHVRHDITRGALREVVRLGLGHDDELGDMELHGKTDRQILLEICDALGHNDDDRHVRCDTMQDLLMEYWHRHLTADTVEVLPGVLDLLDRLHGMENVRLGLLTGNLEPGARLKLAPHDLNRFFPFGAFGSDAVDRVQLPPVAQKRAGDLDGKEFPFDQMLIIGDSHRDIACARAWGIRSLAVATGMLDMEQLRGYDPDAVCESLIDDSYIFEFIESH